MTLYSRRTLIRTATLAAGAVAATGVPAPGLARDSDRRRLGPPTFVLLHGTCASSMYWASLTPELALRGYRTAAVDLPGHGSEAHFPLAYQAPQDLGALATEPSPLAGITLDDYVERVVGVVRRAHRNGPVILVGHSQGGVTVTRVSDAVPHLLDRIVYIAAMCCVDLPSVDDYMATPDAAGSLAPEIARYGLVGNPEELGVLRVNWRSADPRFLAAFKAATAADYSDNALRALINSQEPDETLSNFAADGRGHADRWGRVPRTYIRFTRDRELTVALQDRMIGEADRRTPGNRFDVRSVDAPHAGPMHRPEVVAILDELGRRVAVSADGHATHT